MLFHSNCSWYAFDRGESMPGFWKKAKVRFRKAFILTRANVFTLNIIAMEFIDYVRRHNLDPCNTALWMMDSVIPCNLRLFRHHIKNLCASYGNGMEQAAVYAGGLSMADLSLKVPLDAYFAFMFGGLLRKMGCQDQTL